MCGRFVAPYSLAELRAAFGAAADEAIELEPDYNVAPTDPVQVVRASRGMRVVSTMRWGFATAGRTPHINARVETVLGKRAFRDAFLRRRCLIPAAGFYEWSKRRPYLIAPDDGGMLALAGLWEGEGHRLTCTILTTAANEVIRPLHDRMPVILHPDAWTGWLTGQDEQHLCDLVAAGDGANLVTRPVSTAVNSVRNKGREVLMSPESAPDQLTFDV